MHIPWKFYHIQWEHSFLIVATYSLSKLHIEYVTAILESIIHFDCFNTEYCCLVRGLEHLHQMPHPAFATT